MSNPSRDVRYRVSIDASEQHPSLVGHEALIERARHGDGRQNAIRVLSLAKTRSGVSAIQEWLDRQRR